MLGRAKVLGQPLNPLLTVLPLGILGSAVLVDLGALISGSHLFGRLAQADLAVGLLAGLVSLCAVLIDLITVPAGSVARQILSVVATLTGSMVATFTVLWSVRLDGDGTGSGGALLLELLALAAGILGAGLARRLAVGQGFPRSYLVATAAAGRYLAAAPGWAADAAGTVRRTPAAEAVRRATIVGVARGTAMAQAVRRAGVAEAVRRTAQLTRLMR